MATIKSTVDLETSKINGWSRWRNHSSNHNSEPRPCIATSLASSKFTYIRPWAF